MTEKKVYYVRAKIVMSSEKSDEKSLDVETMNLDNLGDVVISDVSVKSANSIAKDAYDTVCKCTKKCYDVTKGKFKLIKDSTKKKIDNAKANSPDYQEYANASNTREKAKVVVSHIKRDSKAAGQTLKEKYQNLLHLIKEVKRVSDQQKNNEVVIEDDFVFEENLAPIEQRGPSLVKKI